jgi:hypothetical protein
MVGLPVDQALMRILDIRPVTMTPIGYFPSTGICSGDPRSCPDALPRGSAITAPPFLFAKIEDTQTAHWRVRFGGG